MGTELEGLSEEYTTAIEDLDCPDPSGSDEEAFAAIIELAEQEAPGTVGYLQWVQGLAAGFGDAEVSGDCETDISALRAIIDESSSMSDLTMTEVVQVGSLVASVSTACTPGSGRGVLCRARRGGLPGKPIGRAATLRLPLGGVPALPCEAGEASRGGTQLGL